MLDRFGTNSTQLLGILSFSLTTIACSFAARCSSDAKIWKVLAFLNALFLIEILVGFRFRISDWARAVLSENGGYVELHGKDQALIILAVVATSVIMLLFLQKLRIAGPAARVGAALTIVLLALFAIETISLHEIDAIFYRPIGPFLLVGWLWAAASAGICLATLLSRNKSPYP